MKYSNQQVEHIERIDNGRLDSVLATWQLWEHRFKTRRQLRALLLNDSDRLHNDLGLSTKEALEEIRKPFWQ